MNRGLKPYTVLLDAYEKRAAGLIPSKRKIQRVPLDSKPIPEIPTPAAVEIQNQN